MGPNYSIERCRGIDCCARMVSFYSQNLLYRRQKMNPSLQQRAHHAFQEHYLHG